MSGLSPTQGREKSRRMTPKYRTNCPALNKYREDNDEDDETDNEDDDDDDDNCASHMKLLEF